MASRDLPESRLFLPVKAWLQTQGYTVFAECLGHDVVAIRGREIVCVELKVRLTRGLLSQVARASKFADRAYGAVPRLPRDPDLIGRAKRRKLGLLLVVDGVVSVVLEPRTTPREANHEWVADRLAARLPDDTRIGGVPRMAGDGDAQRCLARVAAYRAAHPGCTWRDVFRDVPNHYAHPKSLSRGLAAAAARAAAKERRAKRLRGRTLRPSLPVAGEGKHPDSQLSPQPVTRRLE